MRYKAEHKLKIRQNILAAAGRCLRQYGFNGIGVDGLMTAAGLTSGAFYTQFSSKTDLLIEVMKAGFEKLRANFSEQRRQHQQDWLKAGVERYLSRAHCNNVAEGCILPNLSVDIARSNDTVKKLYESLLIQVVDEIEADVASSSDLTARQRAWATLALMAGGVMLARAMPESETVDELLEACRLFALQKRGEHPTFAKIRDARQDRGVELSTPPMTPEDIERLQSCSREIAEILYRNTPESELENLDGISRCVRRQMLEHVSPKCCSQQ